MQICFNNHKAICFEDLECPICKMINRVENLYGGHRDFPIHFEDNEMMQAWDKAIEKCIEVIKKV